MYIKDFFHKMGKKHISAEHRRLLDIFLPGLFNNFHFILMNQISDSTSVLDPNINNAIKKSPPSWNANLQQKVKNWIVEKELYETIPSNIKYHYAMTALIIRIPPFRTVHSGLFCVTITDINCIIIYFYITKLYNKLCPNVQRSILFDQDQLA